MKHARDFMHKDVISCEESDYLETLAELFFATQYKNIPIIDSNGECTGLFDELSLIKSIAERKQKPEKEKVSDFSAHYIKPSFVNATDNLSQIIPLMLQSESKRLIVVSGSKKPLGVISPSNILKALLGRRPESKKLKDSLDETSNHAETNWKGTDTTDIFRKAFENSPYIMLMTDSDGKIVDCSERFYTSLGYKKDEALGKPLTEYFPSFTHNKIRQAMQMARESGRCPTQPTAMLKANGSFENMEMAFSGVRDENFKLKYYCAILQSVSMDQISSDL